MLYPIIRRVRRPLLPLDPIPNLAAPVPSALELPPKQESPAEEVAELPAQPVETAPLRASAEGPAPLDPIVSEAPPALTAQPEHVIEQLPIIAESAPLKVTTTAKPKRTNNGRKAKTEAA